jgi:CHAD domain-containing protein
MAQLFRIAFSRTSLYFLLPIRFSSMQIAPQRSRAIFRELDQDLARLSSKTRRENIHRLRTGARRLQIMLTDLSPQKNGNQKKLLKLLSRLRKRAGKVRDLDVQLAALRSLKMPREPRRKTQLINELIELRAEQENKLRKTADKDTVRETRKRLKRANKSFDPKAGRNPLAVGKEMLQRIDTEGAPLTEVLMHQYRIATKRARYAAEFAATSSESAQFIAMCKRIQDALGDWHDWLTLTQTASKHLGDVRDSSLVAELHNVTGAKFRHAGVVLSQLRPKPVSGSKHPIQASTQAAPKANLTSAA